MNKKILTALILALCFCSLLAFSSCSAILDFIFGPEGSTDDPGEHVHTLVKQTVEGTTCTGRSELHYYKCSGCGRCFLDEFAQELVDEASLGDGHMYVYKSTDDEHYRQCALCNEEQEGSREPHKSNSYRYNANEHYRECEVCLTVYDRAAHNPEATCEICGRQADYDSMCNSRYGYELLASMENGENMKKVYAKLAEAVTSVHNDATKNCELTKIAEVNGKEIRRYVVPLSVLDYRLSPEQAYVIAASFRSDNPLYYWVDSTVGLSTRADFVEKINICVVDEFSTGAAREAQNVKMYAEIDKYLSAVANAQSDYDIAFALHDEIIKNVHYALKEDGTAQNEHWAHSVLGVFRDKAAVCEGYAKTFQLLLNACKVDNVYVTGEGVISGGKENHAWNLVSIDGAWYWYDLTWDDQPNMARGVIYDYFCQTSENFLNNHIVSTVKTGVDYQYDLPKACNESYETDGLEVGERFTEKGFTYELAGYNRLAVVACSNGGDVVVPDKAVYNGREYTVRELSETALVMSVQNNATLICGATSLTLPSTIDLIYNNSFFDCKTLTRVQFADATNWQRYGLTGSTPVFETVSDSELSLEVKACKLLQQLCSENGQTKKYYYVWKKS